MDFYSVIMDFFWVSVILFVAKIIREHVKILQNFFIPVSLIAGFIAWVVGPYGLKIVPLMRSDSGVYDAVDAIGFHYRTNATSDYIAMADVDDKEVWYSEGCVDTAATSVPSSIRDIVPCFSSPAA